MASGEWVTAGESALERLIVDSKLIQHCLTGLVAVNQAGPLLNGGGHSVVEPAEITSGAEVHWVDLAIQDEPHRPAPRVVSGGASIAILPTGYEDTLAPRVWPGFQVLKDWCSPFVRIGGPVNELTWLAAMTALHCGYGATVVRSRYAVLFKLARVPRVPLLLQLTVTLRDLRAHRQANICVQNQEGYCRDQ